MDIAKSILKLVAMRLLNSVLGFVGIVFFSRELGAAQLGVFFLFQALITFLSIPADFSIGKSLEKRLSEGYGLDEMFVTALTMKAVAISVIGILIVGFNDMINQYVGANVAILLVVALFAQQVAGLMMATLRGELRVGETAIIQFAGQLIWVGGGILLVAIGFGVEGLIYSWIGGSLVKGFWSGWRTTVTPGTLPSIAAAKSMLDFARFEVMSSLGPRFFNWTDILVIGFFLQQVHVGAYEVAWRVAGLTMLFSYSIKSTIFPQMSAWDSHDESEKIQNLLSDSFTPSLFFVLPAILGVIILGPEILGTVFKSEFEIAWLPLILLLGQKIVVGAGMQFEAALKAINRPDYVAVGTIFGVILNIVLNVILVWNLGFIGAALATTLASTAYFSLLYYYLSNYINVRIPKMELGWITFAASIMGIMVWFTTIWISTESILGLISVVMFGALIYAFFALSHRGIRRRLFEVSHRLVQ